MEQRLEAIRAHLVDLREHILLDFRLKNAEAAGLGRSEVADVGDQSTLDDLQDYLHLLSESERQQIAEIDEALDRLEKGTYGICQRCSEEIPPERLKAIPYARFCAPCKEVLEKAA